MRKINFENSSWYHIYNRGANKNEVFLDEKDYIKFLRKVRELNNKTSSDYRDYLFRKIRDEVFKVKPGLGYPKPGLDSELHALCYQKYYQELIKLPQLVEILCYTLNPNHYHFILKQLVDGGVEKFMRRLGLSYCKYFNHKYNHSGTLFQGPFKALSIKDENHLARLSAYVNCNYEIHKIGKAENCKFSSYQDYLGLRNGSLCNKKIILNLFGGDVGKYKEFCELVVKDKQKIKMWQEMYEE
jgi:putative transposase